MRILVIEDEPLIASMLVDWLQELGHEPAGPVATVAEALAVVDGTGIEGALLDINLRDGDGYPVAERLQSRAVPFAFASGDGGRSVVPGFGAHTILAKPYTFEAMEALLAGWEKAARVRLSGGAG